MSSQDQNTVSQGVALDESLVTKSIMETLARRGGFDKTIEAIHKAGRESFLTGVGLTTLFAVPDDKLTLDTEALSQHIDHHILKGRFTTADLKYARKVKTMAGDELEYKQGDGGLRIGEARIDHSDISCTNGQLHSLAEPLK